MKNINELIKNKNIIQFIRFCIVGASNLVVSYVFYIIVIWLGGHYILGNVAGYISGTLYAFFWNNRWVFRAESNEKRNIPVALLKTLISYAGTGLVLNSMLLILWIQILHVPQVIAPAINSAISLCINYLSNKFWIYGRKGKTINNDKV